MVILKFFALVFVSSLHLVTVNSKTAQEWKSRVIYQLLTDRFAKSGDSGSSCGGGGGYCGGTFKGVTEKLDYISGLGINAIWISPVVENTANGYHGYWAQNLNQINHYFGSSQDLKDLVNACHARDIWVMVDVVANHMGYPPGCPGCSMSQETNFGGLSPFNHGEHYHNYCDINNWGDQNEVENCRLAQLPDLNQQNSYVRSTLKNWISNLVKEYGFDGIRIDTIPEVPKDFWSEFGQAAGVFQIGEVDNGNPAYVGPYQGPITATLHYPMYWVLRHVFAEKTSGMKDISNALQGYPSNFKDTSVLGGFVDNHDNPRFLNLNSDWTALKNALTYTIMAQWIPIIYYGTEQAYNGGNDPDNRLSLWPNFNTNHMMYKFISQVNHFRNGLGNDFFEAKQLEKWADDTFYAFTRGNVLVALTNQGSGSTQQRTIPNLPFSDGTVLQNVLDENDKVTANQGKISVSIQNGQPKIYHPMSNQVVTASPKSTARSGSAPSATKRSPSSQNGQHPLEDGSVAGLVVGSVIGAIMVVGVAGVLVYKLKYKKNSYENI